jgi:hypothetical protein
MEEIKQRSSLYDKQGHGFVLAEYAQTRHDRLRGCGHQGPFVPQGSRPHACRCWGIGSSPRRRLQTGLCHDGRYLHQTPPERPEYEENIHAQPAVLHQARQPQKVSFYRLRLRVYRCALTYTKPALTVCGFFLFVFDLYPLLVQLNIHCVPKRSVHAP